MPRGCTQSSMCGTGIEPPDHHAGHGATRRKDPTPHRQATYGLQRLLGHLHQRVRRRYVPRYVRTCATRPSRAAASIMHGHSPSRFLHSSRAQGTTAPAGPARHPRYEAPRQLPPLLAPPAKSWHWRRSLAVGATLVAIASIIGRILPAQSASSDAAPYPRCAPHALQPAACGPPA